MTDPEVVVVPGFPVRGTICLLLGKRFSSLIGITALPRKSAMECENNYWFKSRASVYLQLGQGGAAILVYAYLLL